MLTKMKLKKCWCVALISLGVIAMTCFLTAAPVLAADDESDSRAAAGVLLLAGPAFFGIQFLRYRNSDKRHFHEKETRSNIDKVQKKDDLISHQTGTRNSQMPGSNQNLVEGSDIKSGLRAQINDLSQQFKVN